MLWKPLIRTIWLSGLLLTNITWASQTIDQNTAQNQAEQLNRIASDRSMENSTVFAMQALMDLSSANVPSAVKNGVNAYGKYRNSQGLDRIGDQTFNNSMSMSSAGGGQAKKTETTFRRLDPSFLHKGEAAKVAAEFEKRSGMKRETFLKEMSAISENKISKKDPQLVDKALSKFETFAAKIPNQEFRSNIEKTINMVPQTVRTGVIAKAVSQFSNLFSAVSSSSNPNLAGGATGPLTESPAQTDAANRTPSSSEEQSALNAANDTSGESNISGGDTNNIHEEKEPSLRYGIGEDVPEAEKGALGNVVQAAIDSQEEGITIFQQVSRKIRKLTPELAEIK
ncbi:MAG: hypothetical protein M9962_03825 [Oligoflexia bacterium]|nr:hypothetical protein [Oligoflexia bacterium]